MANPELGTKRVCVACGARFYDLQKTPAVCPKCGAEQPVEQPRVRRPVGNVIEDKRPKKSVSADDADVEIEAVDDADADTDADDDEDVLEDTADLDEDDALDDEIDVGKGSDES